MAAAKRTFELRGTEFQMVRKPRSAIVGIFRMGGTARFLGYVFCDPTRPDWRFFPRFGGWDGGADAWRCMADGALRFYRECVAAERGQVVTGHGR